MRPKRIHQKLPKNGCTRSAGTEHPEHWVIHAMPHIYTKNKHYYTKDRQQALAEAQHAKEAEKAKQAQEIAQKQNTKKASKKVLNYNGNNSDVSNTSPQPPRLTGRGKASYPDQIKSSRGARKHKRHNNDENDNDAENPNDGNYVPLIGDQMTVMTF